jgi:hypothetical protein
METTIKPMPALSAPIRQFGSFCPMCGNEKALQLIEQQPKSIEVEKLTNRKKTHDFST